MIVKQRLEANAIDRMDLIGEVNGKDVIIIDDMIDTAGTLCKAAATLKEKGAKKIYAFASHGLFNEPAAERIKNSDLEEVIVTNSIPLKEGTVENSGGKIRHISIELVLAEAIRRIQNKESVSAIFETGE